MLEFGTLSIINCLFGGNDCGTVKIKFSFVQVTWQQAFKNKKNLNNWCSCQRTSYINPSV